MMEWVADAMRDKKAHSELVLVMRGKSLVEFSHSGTYVALLQEGMQEKLHQEAKPLIQ
jgi:hypothetical protein